MDVGNDAITDIDQQQIRFFDQWLKSEPEQQVAPVRLFDMGACQWQDLQDLPEGNTQAFPYGSGRTAIDTRDGALAPAVPDDALALSESLTLDPWRPAAPCGGSFGFPGGPVDRARTDARSDVLIFTTPLQETDRLLAGTVTGCFEFESEYESFDIHATLSRVDRHGKVHPLAEGYALAKPGQTLLPMRGTCLTLKKGERLRLSLSLACFPVFPINPGTGDSPIAAPLDQQQVTTVHLKTGLGTYLLLPWLKQES
ncbi:predicted acyl esterase [Gluconobacter frateurii NBRC 103465]|nr:predicted acyl esterase [Gluconobacter frateurii NBRC 103465]